MPTDDGGVEAALREERELVLSLGGFALEQAGGVLVFNERIPVPRFNFVQYIRVHRNRQSAFLERALDQYFQRALRPSIRVERPVPGFLDGSLRLLGFTPDPVSVSLLVRAAPGRLPPADPKFEVRAAAREEVPEIASFWAGPKEREELVRQLDVVVTHPNPDEQVIPAVAFRSGEPVSAALLHVHQRSAGIHAVATRPGDRGQGAATALVAGLLRARPLADAVGPVAMWSESPRLNDHLRPLGFEPAREYCRYSLGAGRDLALPTPAAAGPPRWRPPRRSVPGSP